MLTLGLEPQEGQSADPSPGRTRLVAVGAEGQPAQPLPKEDLVGADVEKGAGQETNQGVRGDHGRLVPVAVHKSALGVAKVGGVPLVVPYRVVC